ncbi:hypothetical protein JW948_13845 [bacterium]|nr:hypothetical protein [bacterium]
MPKPYDFQQLIKMYSIELTEKELQAYIEEIDNAQQYFSSDMQNALLLKLLYESDSNKKDKIITTSTLACRMENGICVTTFGILSPDWPGLSNACLGVIHAMDWNIYLVKGFTIHRKGQDLGVVIIGVRTECEEDYQKLLSQTTTILTRLVNAAQATQGKISILFEEIRKVLAYSNVITHIENTYSGEDLESIIGPSGEAVHYFNARSRDYIENRSVPDIAQQIIRNYNFIKQANKTSTIQLDISNFTTVKEGTFTGVTIAGPAHMLNLEDSLKTIELTIPGFILKHNREFTTKEGIACYRIELVDQLGRPLTEFEQNRLNRAFSTMVLNKRRHRAQWIESIGGFEQYARAIIPLLVREAQKTEITQVYQSVDRATDLFIVFKIISVVPNPKLPSRDMLNLIVKKIESEPGLHILAFKPPKMYGNVLLNIIDIKASLVDLENTEAVYRLIRDKLQEAIGQYRDFDEGMRSIDTTKLKTLQRMIDDIDSGLVREIYYNIEDFHRISATISELISHIRIACDMIVLVDKENKESEVICRQAGTHNKSGKFVPQATLICIAYNHELEMLDSILDVLGEYELTMSRLERTGKDILICRLTQNDKALTEDISCQLCDNIRSLIDKKNEEAKKK